MSANATIPIFCACVLTSASLIGCLDDACDPDQDDDSCEGQTAHVCRRVSGDANDFTWLQSVCSGETPYCIEAPGIAPSSAHRTGAGCSIYPQPEPLCYEHPSEPVCKGDLDIVCGGYGNVIAAREGKPFCADRDEDSRVTR